MSSFVECTHCERRIDVTGGPDAYASHLENDCPMRPLRVSDLETLRAQVGEIHAFIKGVAEALDNPMVRAMMPPNMRGIGK